MMHTDKKSNDPILQDNYSLSKALNLKNSSVHIRAPYSYALQMKPYASIVSLAGLVLHKSSLALKSGSFLLDFYASISCQKIFPAMLIQKCVVKNKDLRYRVCI